MAESLAGLTAGTAYVDAVILIAHLTPGHVLNRACARFLRRAAADEPGIGLITSTLTMDEVVMVLLQQLVAGPPLNVSRDRTRHLQRNSSAVRTLTSAIRPRLLDLTAIFSLLPVLPEDVVQMTNNMAAHGLLPRDAMHVAVAQRLGIRAIVSDDDAFDRVPGITLYKPEPEP